MTGVLSPRNPLIARETARLLHHGPALLIGVLLVWMPLSMILRVFWEQVGAPLAMSPLSLIAFAAIPLVLRPDIPLALVLAGIVFPQREWRAERTELVVTRCTVSEIVGGKVAPICGLLLFLNIMCIPVFYPNLLPDIGLPMPTGAWRSWSVAALTAFASLEDILYAFICVLFAAEEAMRGTDRVYSAMRMLLRIFAVGILIATWGVVGDIFIGGLLVNRLPWTGYLLASNAIFLAPTLTLECVILARSWKSMRKLYVGQELAAA